MKTLEQIEPRIDLFNAPASAGVSTSDANSEFVITKPGSYYLTRNLSVMKYNGINVAIDGVTLDLNGFEIAGADDSRGTAIIVKAVAHRTTIRNGSITRMIAGIGCESVSSSRAKAGTASQIAVSHCRGHGLSLGDGWHIEACKTYANTGIGIVAGIGSSVSNCTSSDNDDDGILAFSGSALVNCAVRDNKGAGMVAYSGSTVSHCAASGNGRDGFALKEGCTITDCSADGNTADGITANYGKSRIARNVAKDNGVGTGVAAGIRVAATDNRIEENHSVDNDIGFEITGSGNLVVKNSAAGNTLNYSIAAGNRYGAILDLTATDAAAATGNSAPGTLSTTTNPWANFAH
jgi:parallel beta-helix repeat protein